MNKVNQKLGALALTAIVVSAMIGGGIFSLPQNMAQSAGLTAVLLAWIITGVGIFFLANTFRTLSDVRPDAAALKKTMQGCIAPLQAFPFLPQYGAVLVSTGVVRLE